MAIFLNDARRKIFWLTGWALAVVFSGQVFSQAQAPVWTMVDCNAGRVTQDCHVLRDSGEIAIVDTGTVEATREYFLPYLKTEGITKVDHFLISHPHNNHVGGLIEILNAGIDIKNIYFSRPFSGHEDFSYNERDFEALLVEAVSRGANLRELVKGDVIKLPSSRMIVLAAEKERQAEVNDYSIIVRWEAGGYSTLFSGDLSENLGKQFVGDSVFSADFYKAPHHGVTPIAPDSFSDTVDPILTMVPQPKILERHPRGLQFFNWTKKRELEKNMITCTNGSNGTVSLFLQQVSVRLVAERESGSCRNAIYPFKPKAVVDVPFIKNSDGALAPITGLLLE